MISQGSLLEGHYKHIPFIMFYAVLHLKLCFTPDCLWIFSPSLALSFHGLMLLPHYIINKIIWDLVYQSVQYQNINLGILVLLRFIVLLRKRTMS